MVQIYSKPSIVTKQLTKQITSSNPAEGLRIFKSELIPPVHLHYRKSLMLYTQGGVNLVVKSTRITSWQHVSDNNDGTTNMFSHQACPFLWLCSCLFSSEWMEVQGPAQTRAGKSDCKQVLHKPDLTYFVERFKCKLTGNVLAGITCFQYCGPPH